MTWNADTIRRLYRRHPAPRGVRQLVPRCGPTRIVRASIARNAAAARRVGR
jgi:predicted RNA-binding Zn-ribbon protein involved in translation (DUF1610 family)